MRESAFGRFFLVDFTPTNAYIEGKEAKEQIMVEVIAYYTVWDRRTGDRIEDYDVFKVDDRDAADKLIKKIDNGNYDSFAIQEI